MAQSQQNMDVVNEAINAMIPWMKMFSICEWSELHNLLDLLVNLCKKSVQLGEHSLCENCLEMLSSIIADPNTHLFPSVILTILDKILPLQATLDVILDVQDMVSRSIISAFTAFIFYSTELNKILLSRV